MELDSTHPVLGAPFFSEHLARYYFAKKFVKNKSVLDLACGQGYGSHVLAQDADQVLGVDMNQENLDFAAKNYSLENLKFIQMDATKLEYLNAKFDIIIAFEIIEHIRPEQMPAFLKGIVSKLNAGGVVLISTPNHDVVLKSGVQVPAFHINNLKASDLKKELKKYFFNVKMLGQVRKRFPLAMLAHLLDVFNLRHAAKKLIKKSRKKDCVKDLDIQESKKIWQPEQGEGDSANWIFSNLYWRQAGMVVAICQNST